jgi:NAD(P) transhydrogenase subunit beta
MSQELSALLYLVAGSLFILALRGLSSPATSRRGNMLGMIGMTIAIITTLFVAAPSAPIAWALIVGGLGLGALIGAVTARRIAMTAMPQLVAAFHSLVGLAAVFVAASAFYAPEAFGIGHMGEIHGPSLIEMSLGAAIGAITFTGSVIAFGKLSGHFQILLLIFTHRHLVCFMNNNVGSH